MSEIPGVDSAAQKRLQDFLEITDQIKSKITPLLTQAFQRGMRAERKDAASPVVTKIDLETEEIVRVILESRFPEDSIIGEELPDRIGSSPYSWVIDPIDGTIGFRTGKPMFTTLLALVLNQKSIAGWIYQPILKKSWTGRMGMDLISSDHYDPQPVPDSLTDCVISTTTYDMFQTSPYQEFFAKIREHSWMTTYGGDAYQYGLLAQGRVDVVVETQMEWHDYAALVPIIESAGGMISDFSGNPLTRGSSSEVLASRAPHLHTQVLEIFQEFHENFQPHP